MLHCAFQVDIGANLKQAGQLSLFSHLSFVDLELVQHFGQVLSSLGSKQLTHSHAIRRDRRTRHRQRVSATASCTFVTNDQKQATERQ